MQDHTSLLAWQEARGVVLSVLEISETHWKPRARALFDQLQRASTSAQINIAEGYSYRDSPTFHKHLRIAYGSAVESGDVLELLLASRIVPDEIIRPVLLRCKRSQRLLLGLIKRYADRKV